MRLSRQRAHQPAQLQVPGLPGPLGPCSQLPWPCLTRACSRLLKPAALRRSSGRITLVPQPGEYAGRLPPPSPGRFPNLSALPGAGS